MPDGVDYSAFESLNIDLGAGNDTFTIESTHATSDVDRFTTVEGRGGNDTIIRAHGERPDDGRAATARRRSAASSSPAARATT